MIERLTTGWTFVRVLYLFMGIVVIGQAISQKEWLGVLFGGYFASMGLFRFGCAAGACYTMPSNKAMSNKNGSDEEVTFEEIK